VTRTIGSVAVFCGSNNGNLPEYTAAAAHLGALLAEQGIRLVYGGGKVGLMGTIADAVLGAGGTVTGVIPQHLWDKEVGHDHLTELLVVGSMHERKLAMADRADAFIAMPGGVGTFGGVRGHHLEPSSASTQARRPARRRRLLRPPARLPGPDSRRPGSSAPATGDDHSPPRGRRPARRFPCSARVRGGPKCAHAAKR
jgi:hypothetical protein